MESQSEKQPVMRIATEEDLNELKEIWKLCFGDEDSFIDFYFRSRDWLAETAVLLYGDKIASMLTMIPAEIVGADGRGQKTSMLYAIATHPDFQKRGFADQLIEYSNHYLLTKQVTITLLVPAGEDLFRFYEKRGYQDGFFVREADLSRQQICELTGNNQSENTAQKDENNTDCRISRIGPEEYNLRRKKLLEGHNYLSYRDDEIAFQKNLGLLFDADLLAIDEEGAEGCAYYERISQEVVIIKELLISDESLAAALQQIAAEIGCDRFIVRTPSWSGECLGGVVRAFGMLRNNMPDNPVKGEFYLGIAYD